MLSIKTGVNWLRCNVTYVLLLLLCAHCLNVASEEDLVKPLSYSSFSTTLGEDDTTDYHHFQLESTNTTNSTCGCATNSDCGTNYVCVSDPQRANCNMCTHKPLFHPFNSYDVIGTVISLVLVALAAGGGIGGGGLLVPIFILFVDFPPQNAVALSKVDMID